MYAMYAIINQLNDWFVCIEADIWLLYLFIVATAGIILFNSPN
jgi:hypothetical protein